MGRASNRKWAKRKRQFRKAKFATDKLRLQRLYGHHRKFRDTN